MNRDERHIKGKKLLKLIKSGNRLAFNELYGIYWKELFHYSHKILAAKDLAEDVLQDVFLKIWINRKDLEISNLKSYLYNATRNASISKLRERKFTDLQIEVIESLPSNSRNEDRLFYEDLLRDIDIASEGLPDRCREIFYLSRIQNYSIEEIANELKISRRTVENQISIALKHIRPQLSSSAMLTWVLIQCFT